MDYWEIEIEIEIERMRYIDIFKNEIPQFDNGGGKSAGLDGLFLNGLSLIQFIKGSINYTPYFTW